MIATQHTSLQRTSPRTQRLPFPSITPTAPASPPKTPPRARRPSLSHPMAWLTRSSTNGSSHSAPHPSSKPPYASSKPIRISEPKFTNSLDILNSLRSGALGTGATVVRTPQEALSGTAVHLTFDGTGLDDEKDYGDDESEYDDYGEEGDHESKDLPSPPESPTLPVAPLSKSSASCLFQKTEPAPPRPTRAVPVPPVPAPSIARRSSLKIISPPESEYSPPVPPLPCNVTPSPPQPPFEPILVSPVPTNAIDPTKIIVSLETSTTTHRTTLSTLTSRPSCLSTYLTSLLPRSKRDSDADSVHSDMSAVSDNTHSPFNSVFHNHLTSSGLLPASTSTMHVFLDRPSAPYAHILSYLRSLPPTPGVPEVLPRAVQLLSSSPSRFEALLELRDEAQYLDLKELYKLCTDEIRQRQGLGLHTRGSSGVSNGSVHSIHTLRERAEQDSRDSYDARGIHHVANEMGVRSSSYAVPQFISARRRSSTRFNSLRSAPHLPPAGWI